MTIHKPIAASVRSRRALLLNGVVMAAFDQIRATLIVEVARQKVIACQ
jgi:type II secretory pathway component PulC